MIRAWMLQLGGRMLAELLAADPGYRGPRVPGGQVHEAEFAAYRDEVTDTVLGPLTVSRAWYHCAQCGHGLAPRDAELGVAGVSMSPGLAAVNDRVAAAGPFARAAGLLEDLAGVSNCSAWCHQMSANICLHQCCEASRVGRPGGCALSDGVAVVAGWQAAGASSADRDRHDPGRGARCEQRRRWGGGCTRGCPRMTSAPAWTGRWPGLPNGFPVRA